MSDLIYSIGIEKYNGNEKEYIVIKFPAYNVYLNQSTQQEAMFVCEDVEQIIDAMELFIKEYKLNKGENKND